MPVKWDATKDQFILVQVINESSNTISTATWQKVMDAWPSSLGEKPTIRAMTEHMLKLKSGLSQKGLDVGGSASKPKKKTSGSSTFGTPDPSSPATPATKTPKSAAHPKLSSTARTAGKGPSKRKRNATDDDGDSAMAGAASSSDEITNDTPSAPRTKLPRKTKTPEKRAKFVDTVIKAEEKGSDDDEEDGAKGTAGDSSGVGSEFEVDAA